MQSRLKQLENLNLCGCSVTQTPDFQEIISSTLPALKHLDRFAELHENNIRCINCEFCLQKKEKKPRNNPTEKERSSKPPPQHAKLFSLSHLSERPLNLPGASFEPNNSTIDQSLVPQGEETTSPSKTNGVDQSEGDETSVALQMLGEEFFDGTDEDDDFDPDRREEEEEEEGEEEDESVEYDDETDEEDIDSGLDDDLPAKRKGERTFDPTEIKKFKGN